jgi:hypothetical protein
MLQSVATFSTAEQRFPSSKGTETLLYPQMVFRDVAAWAKDDLRCKAGTAAIWSQKQRGHAFFAASATGVTPPVALNRRLRNSGPFQSPVSVLRKLLSLFCFYAQAAGHGCDAGHRN